MSEELLEGAIWLPDFPFEDLCAVSELLKTADVFVPGYIPPDRGVYDLEEFLYRHMIEQATTILLPDRNIVSRIAQVVQGEAMDSQRRLACAVLAFAQGLEIDIEPSIAYHELAHKNDNATAHIELGWFRRGDDSVCTPWLDAALGRSDRVPLSQNPVSSDSLDLALPLKRWRRNYIVALKIAALELSGAPALEKMVKLLEWMRDDFILAGPATMLAAVYFAPMSPPRKGLFKQLRSSDRERAIAGVRNVAWDITHLSDFVARVQNASHDEVRYLFASFDHGLCTVARLLVSDSENIDDYLLQQLSPWWPDSNVVVLVEHIASAFNIQRDAAWFQRQQSDVNKIDQLIAEGEALIRETTYA
ncbi:MAG: hypothetical protein QM709_12260 [Spongiibacteraceae bacterium]